MKRIIAVLLALIMCMSFCASAFAEDDWTIFVYICGADLESQSALATENMQEMIDSNCASNIRFVVQTGGASAWSNGASPDELDRFVITEGNSEIVDRQPQASMANSDTLRDFISWGLTNYPASHYGLVLWNHGGGSISGVCFDELDDDHSLTLRAIDTALSGVQSMLPDGGFDFIGFDACLMSTVENAGILASYAQYMIASQEIEPGSGWDFTAIGSFLTDNPDADVTELGTAICDAYYDHCAASESEDCATLAVTDLSKIADLRTAFDAFAQDVFNSTEAGTDYAPIARTIAGAENFGGNNPSEGYTNMVDLGALIDSGESVSSHASEARDALDDAIVYKVSGSDHPQASGLSVYYPLCVQGSEELSTFRDICVSSYYLALVNKVAYTYANGGGWDTYDGSNDWNPDNIPQDQGQSTVIAFSEAPHLNDNGVYSFTLSEEGLKNAASVQAVVYLLPDDGADSICLGYTSDVKADWQSGTFDDNFDGYWFSLPDGQCLSVYLIDECDGYDLFTSPVEVNGNRKNLRFSWDHNTGKVEIAGLWDGIDDNGIAGRPNETLKAGDKVIPLHDAISNNSDEESTYRGESFVWQNDSELGFGMLPEGNYLYGFYITDIFGGFFVSDFAQFSVNNGSILYNAA